jgi:(R,R)-butanediol dehydrogenase/meso-butanediol dehydrogenase/diacetyl reductase
MATVPSELMTAAIYCGDGRIEVDQVPVPEPRPGELLVEVAECGICGSDLHLVFEQYARSGAILGHEWSGTVVAANGPVHDRPTGARVVSNSSPGCGVCRPCRRGRPSVCLRRESSDIRDMRGAFARYVVVPASSTLLIPDSLDLRAAALAEPTAIAVHAVGLVGVGPDDRVLVTGGGPIGLLIVSVLLAQGVRDITVSEPSDLRRLRADAVGAARTVRPEELVEAPPGGVVATPVDVVFECSGRPAAGARALDQLDRAGTLVFVGTGPVPVPVNHNRMIILELEVVGAYNYSADGFRPAVDLLADGSLPVDLLVEADDVPLHGVMDAMERMSRGEVAAKVLVNPGLS